MKKTIFAAALLAAALAHGGGADKAANLLKGLEGFLPSVYKCAAGRDTIGYGFTEGRLLARGRMTEGEATAELERICGEIAVRLRKEGGIILNPSEEAAVVSFVYNVGWGAFKSSTMFRLLKAGRRGAAIGAEFRKWVYVTKGGKKVVSKGLASRRAEEARMFMCG